MLLLIGCGKGDGGNTCRFVSFQRTEPEQPMATSGVDDALKGRTPTTTNDDQVTTVHDGRRSTTDNYVIIVNITRISNHANAVPAKAQCFK